MEISSANTADRVAAADLVGVAHIDAGPLAFAGEHTARGHCALMEGAIRSGRRAARSLASLHV